MASPFKFVTKRFFVAKPPPGIGDDFNFEMVCGIDGRTVRFVLTWNEKNHQYAMDILLADGTRIKKLYVTAGDWNLVRNFNVDDPSVPDAYVVVPDLKGNNEPPLPGTWGVGHTVVVMTGEVEKA